MTYNVFGGTLNLAQSILFERYRFVFLYIDQKKGPSCIVTSGALSTQRILSFYFGLIQ